jgi:hypothetical protein
MLHRGCGVCVCLFPLQSNKAQVEAGAARSQVCGRWRPSGGWVQERRRALGAQFRAQQPAHGGWPPTQHRGGRERGAEATRARSLGVPVATRPARVPPSRQGRWHATVWGLPGPLGPWESGDRGTRIQHRQPGLPLPGPRVSARFGCRCAVAGRPWEGLGRWPGPTRPRPAAAEGSAGREFAQSIRRPMLQLPSNRQRRICSQTHLDGWDLRLWPPSGAPSN